MATYFQGNPEIQAPDGLQTLVLTNPGYVQFADSLPPPPTNFVFFNSGAGGSLTRQNLHHALPSQSPQFAGTPLPVSLYPPSKEPNSLPHHLSASHGLIPKAMFNHRNPINSPDARDSQSTTQGLFLRLSSQNTVSGEGIQISGNTNEISRVHGAFLCSKYLKAAQDLLEEIVNLGNDETKNESPRKPNGTKLSEEPSMAETENDGGEEARKDNPELSTAERQDIQRKKAKLIKTLDEVEQRYRQYHNQIQIVISSLERATGMGSARSYTSLALKTISKQFRGLKDRITGQIRALNKSLGEEDEAGGKIGSSRLKFLDYQHRQNAWRPQRGLPERSVSVLRSWLFDHFLHPYPKDSDKQMLAKQTGLTRSQVSNWFINARVRLWKPMVEELYTEETQERQQINSAENSSPNSIAATRKAPPMEDLPPSSQSTDELSTITASKSSMAGNVSNSSALRLPPPLELGSSPKKPKSSELIMDSSSNLIKGNEAPLKVSPDEHSFPVIETEFPGRFVEFPIGRYNNEQYTTRFSVNGVSLTLGLPHHNYLSNHHLGRRIDIGEPDELAGINPPTTIQNRKRFVAQLLPDFVA